MRGRDAALGITVVEQQDQRFEGPAVAAAAEPERRDLAGPQRAFTLDEDGGQLLVVLRGDESAKGRRVPRLGPEPVRQ